MHFRSSNEKNYYYSRTFRFVSNDNKKNLGLIDSYATKAVSIDYDDILEKFVIDDMEGFTYPILLLKCKNGKNLVFSPEAQLRERILEMMSSLYNDISQDSMWLILASKSKYEDNIEKIRNM